MNRGPSVSVVVPVHNRAHQILRTLNAVWAQTMTDLEVIVVDDGSTDELHETLATVEDSRLRVVQQPQGGAASARNRGVDEARGDYIAYLDSDDTLLPYHLADSIAELASTEADVLFSPMIVDRGVGKYIVRPTRGMRPDETFGEFRWESGEPLLISTLVVDSATARRVVWDERLAYGDVDQYLHDLFLCTDEVRFLDRPGAFYDDRTGPAKLSQPWSSEGHASSYRAFLDWFGERRDEFSASTQAAFAARVEVSAEPSAFAALKTVTMARRAGILSSRDAAREFVRSRLPTGYRRLADTVVFMRGASLADILTWETSTTPPGRGCPRCGEGTAHASPVVTSAPNSRGAQQ